MEPRARRKDLEIQRLDDEVVIYDLRSDRAHALDPMAVQVWELADGTRDVAALTQVLQERINEDVTEEDVIATIAILSEAYLMEAGMSRRDILRRAAMVGAVTLVGGGMLKSILAPEPAAAQSGCLLPPPLTCT